MGYTQWHRSPLFAGAGQSMRSEGRTTMPFSGGPDTSVPAPTTRATVHVAFNVTLAVAGTAQDFATIPVGKVGHNIRLVNLGPGDVCISPDATASAGSGIMVRAREEYRDEGLGVATRWSFVGEAGKTPAIRGVVWCGLA